jgi:hypothetical protein
MTTQKLTSGGRDNRQLSDAHLDVVSGGLGITVCVFGYCASVANDGLSVGVTFGKGESAGTQVYNAVMKGMGGYKA